MDEQELIARQVADIRRLTRERDVILRRYAWVLPFGTGRWKYTDPNNRDHVVSTEAEAMDGARRAVGLDPAPPAGAPRP